MTPSHRVRHRREVRRARRFRLVAAVLLGLVVVVAGALAVWQWGGGSSGGGGSGGVTTSGGLPRLARPPAGRTLTVGTPEGYAYTIEGVSTGTTDDEPPPTTGASPGGRRGYADYLLTNSGKRDALLDFPPSLFMRVERVPAEVKPKCGDRAGENRELCEVPSHGRLVGLIADSKPLVKDDVGGTFLPPGSSCLIRVVTDFPVARDVAPSDLRLYVLNVRFTGDRIPRQVYFPG